MNCTICGQATLPGAMLCRPCKAALKRARYLSVQDLPRASILRPRRSRSSASKRSGPAMAQPHVAATIPDPELTPRPPSSPVRQLLAGAGAVAILAVVAYFGQRHLGASADATARGAARDVPVALSPMPDSAHAPPAAATAASLDAPAKAAPAAPPAPPAPSADPAPVRPATTTPPRTRPAPPRPDPAAVAATAAPVVIEMVAPPPQPAPPPPAPVVRPAPPPDRWQSMSNALSQCAREGGFGGIVCDQKVRLESCEGYWGRVPQCPLPPENPGGQ